MNDDARSVPHPFVEDEEDDLCHRCRGLHGDPIHRDGNGVLLAKNPVPFKHPEQPVPTRVGFLGDYRFPVVGTKKRRAALRELRMLVSWSETDIENAGALAWRISEAKPEDLQRLSGRASRVYAMLREACTRGAKYEVALTDLVARCERLEEELQRLRRSRR